MAGIYIHIPFCKKACIYCNFHFTTSIKNKQQLIDAIIKEIDVRKDYCEGEIIETIYFGGGTPSILSPSDIDKILNTVLKFHKVNTIPEITLEANPDNINTSYLTELKKTGINRLSIGIQSFRDKDLKYLGRTHSALQASESILNAQKSGFDNITADLIYGIPGLTKKSWLENLNIIYETGIPHFSAYSLTVEEKTILHKQIEKQIKLTPSEMQARQHFNELLNFAEKKGFEHYEISNFAKNGYISKHNSSYWSGKKYCGIGPSAHSFNGCSRQWNITVNRDYIDQIEKDKIFFVKEDLSRKDKINEMIMLELRTSKGLNSKTIFEMMSKQERNIFSHIIDLQINNGYIKSVKGILYLTNEGMWFSDRIISELFLT